MLNRILERRRKKKLNRKAQQARADSQKKADEKLDQALADTFPASDPVAAIEPGTHNDPAQRLPDFARPKGP